MELTFQGTPSNTFAKAFPPGRRGVLLPVHDRRTAALGICLYTASKPWVIKGLRAAFWATSIAGAKALPGPKKRWLPPCPTRDWDGLAAQLIRELGPFDGIASYQRRQITRGGGTALLTRSANPWVVVKVRETRSSLDVEQRALRAVEACRPSTFRSPRPLGVYSLHERLHWSAQSAVFRRPHAPYLTPPDELFTEVSRCLAQCFPASPGKEPAHLDLTPWNLRLDHLGQAWLFDWEDCGLAPQSADATYFLASAAALGANPRSVLVSDEAVAFWLDVVSNRRIDNPGDRKLALGLLKELRLLSTASPKSPGS